MTPTTPPTPPTPSTPRTTEDLRRELSRQARATAAWPVPETATGRRRAAPSRWQTAGVTAVAAAVVAAALVLPGLLGDSRTEGPPAAGEPIAWEVEEGPCTGRPDCVLPQTVVVDGERLTLTASGTTEPLTADEPGEAPDAAGLPDIDLGFSVDDSTRPAHVLVGSTSGTDSELTVRLEGERFGITGSELPAMFEVRAPGQRVSAAAWEETRPLPGGRLYIGLYEPFGLTD